MYESKKSKAFEKVVLNLEFLVFRGVEIIKCPWRYKISIKNKIVNLLLQD